MICIDPQTTTAGLLLFAVLFDKTFCFAVNCEDPGYLVQLKNEVRQFYTLANDTASGGFAPRGPCSDVDGNQISRPRSPVHTLEPWHAEMSTCPWVLHVDEDSDGYRYPCRIATTRLVVDNEHPHHIQKCFSQRGSRHGRSGNKVCKSLLQMIPVVARTGCRSGINDYEIQNININVGFTCTFV